MCVLQAATDYSRASGGGDSTAPSDRVDVIKLPAHSNGTASLNIPSFSSPSFSSTPGGGTDAPLNLSLKPGGSAPSTPLQALALSVAAPHERICEYNMAHFWIYLMDYHKWVRDYVIGLKL